MAWVKSGRWQSIVGLAIGLQAGWLGTVIACRANMSRPDVGSMQSLFGWCQGIKVGRDSSVSIVTHYRFDVQGSNPSGGEIFRTRPDRPWSPPSLLYNGYRVFPGIKAAGVWRWPPTPSSAEAKERVELYLCSLSGPLWPVLGWTLPYLCQGIQRSEGEAYCSPQPSVKVKNGSNHASPPHPCKG
jgi:hypothetical protein